MPRKARFFLPNVPVHAIARGNARRDVFKDDEDKSKYLSCVQESSSRYETAVHAYVLMDNHIHLLISSLEPQNISKFMQHIGRMYVPYFNHKYNKSGTLWEGRFKASLIEDEHYLLTCYRYIELNPVRANMVANSSQYQWSSYGVNALGEKSAIITAHPIYNALGMNKIERVKNYQEGFKTLMDEDTVIEIQKAAQTGTPLGTVSFKEKVEKLLSVKVGYTNRGRPAQKN